MINASPVPAVTDANFWEIAKISPITAMRSEWFDVLTLLEPERWLWMQENNAARWVMEGVANELPLAHLHDAQVSEFIADCAERLLPVYEACHPESSVLRDAIRARRDLAHGVITLEQLQQVQETCRKASWEHSAKPVTPSIATRPRARIASPWPCMKAVRAMALAGPAAVVEGLVSASATSRDDSTPGSYQYSHGRARQEAQWQWKRLLWYLREQP